MTDVPISEAHSDSDEAPTQQQTSADDQNMCIQTCSTSNSNITEMNNKEGILNLEKAVEIPDVATQEHKSQKILPELSVEIFEDEPHAKREEKTRKYVFLCHQCSKKFNRPYKLRHHLEWHKGKLYKCELCEKVLGSAASLCRHIKIHSMPVPDKRKAKKEKKPHKYHLCSKLISTPDKLQEHLDRHEAGKLYVCKICLKALACLQELKEHAQHCHNLASEGFEDAEKQRKKLTKPRKMFICDFCGRKFHNSGSLKFRLNWHNQDGAAKCKVCRKVLATRNGLRIHMKIHRGDKPHECEFCQKRFSTLQNLKVHRRVHTGEKPYSCKECSRSFTQIGNYKFHMKIHTGDISECKDCGKKFENPIHFKNHQKLHSGERSFVCERCGLSFIAHGSLLTPTKKHAADKNWVPRHVQKPIICDHCGKIFVSKKSLMQHLESHPGNWLFHCTDCGESFELESSLKKHIFMKHKRDKSHGREILIISYGCKICERKFQQSTELKKHLENEHEVVLPESSSKAEKPTFVCVFCGKVYLRKGILKAHERRHAGKNPYVCEVCSNTFMRKHDLDSHMALHTSNSPFSCKFCGIYFITEYKLEVHEIRHYPKNVQKMLREKLKNKE